MVILDAALDATQRTPRLMTDTRPPLSFHDDPQFVATRVAPFVLTTIAVMAWASVTKSLFTDPRMDTHALMVACSLSPCAVLSWIARAVALRLYAQGSKPPVN